MRADQPLPDAASPTTAPSSVGADGATPAPEVVSGDDPTADLGRCDILSPGRHDAPLVVLIAGWKARFIFDPLVERLPSELGVAVVSLYPTAAHDRTAIIDDIPGCVRYVEGVLRTLPDELAGRPLALLGFSRSGLVAHEVASRSSGADLDVCLHVFVDTVYPGEEVRLRAPVRSRRDTYRILLASRRYGAVLKRLRNAALVRARRAALRAGTSLLRTAGVPPDRVIVRGPVRPLTEDDYTPGPVDHAVLVYRASLSDPAYTTERWREVIPHLEEVVVEGEHTGDDGVLGRQRIDQIADDLSRRLGALG